MHKQFNGVSEIFPDEVGKLIDLFMSLVNVEIPRHSEMTVDMQRAAIFDDPDIVDVHPIFTAVIVKDPDHFP
jgi:hypothetical protein